MSSRGASAVAIAGALLLAATACGSSHRALPRSPAGRIVVEQTVQYGGALPIEGAYSYVRVETSRGRVVTEKRIPSSGRATFDLDRGSYELISYQRTCDGNCTNLDPASDRCSTGFTIMNSRSLFALIRVTYGAGCRILFAPTSDDTRTPGFGHRVVKNY